MSKALKDIGVCLAIMFASALVYWDSLKLRPGSYDPLGSGTMPRMVAVGIIILCLVAMVQAVIDRNKPARKPLFDDEGEFTRRPWLSVAIFGLLLVSAIMFALKVPFGVTGSLLLFISTLMIKRGDKSVIIPGAIISVAFGFGLTYLFGNIFGVDLP